MKVAIVAVMVVLAMGVAFVGGLLVASKVIASREAQVEKIAPITAEQVKAKEEKTKGEEGSVAKGLEAATKNERKQPTTDELIAMVDYSVTESRDAGKLLFRKKLVENMKATEDQLDAESEKAKEKARLASSIQRWLERSKNQ